MIFLKFQQTFPVVWNVALISRISPVIKNIQCVCVCVCVCVRARYIELMLYINYQLDALIIIYS